MKIVILDGHAVNPGDVSWDCFRQFGDVTVYEFTQEHQIIGAFPFSKGDGTADKKEQRNNIIKHRATPFP